MHKENTQLHTTINSLRFAIAMLFVMLLLPLSAHAQALGVSFGSNPLFHVDNFSPGDTTQGDVEVNNGTEEVQHVYVEAIHVVDEEEFSKILNIKIFEDDTTYYDGSFWEFLVGGPQPLSTQNPGDIDTFTFEVSFGAGETGNQESTLGFDLCVGFEGGSFNCGDTVISQEIPGDGGGGENSEPPHMLIINNEHVASTDLENGTALIAWTTNILATSQVIYGLASGTYALDLNDLPFFGYPFGSTEVTTKTIDHVVALEGLIPGETYKYRVISRASPPTVSSEGVFTLAQYTPSTPEQEINTREASAEGNSFNDIEITNPSSSGGVSEVIPEEETLEIPLSLGRLFQTTLSLLIHLNTSLHLFFTSLFG